MPSPPRAPRRPSPRVSPSPPPARGREQRQLRIIGGHWRGRKFRFPPLALRPTPDRVRETLFNWLQTHLPGARCLDLYAGSGALGLEALSRGAASVVFVEEQRRATQAIEQLLLEWRSADRAPLGGARVICAQAQQFLASDAALTQFDVVFLDPPFAAGELARASAALEKRGWLAAGARIYIEQPRSTPLPSLPHGWRELRSGSAGEVGYHLFAPAAGPARAAGAGASEGEGEP